MYILYKQNVGQTELTEVARGRNIRKVITQSPTFSITSRHAVTASWCRRVGELWLGIADDGTAYRVRWQDDTITNVIFRTWTAEGDSIIALFPDEPADLNGNCLSYMHVGQHGAANRPHVMRRSWRATPAEYADLKRELETLGYNLNVLY